MLNSLLTKARNLVMKTFSFGQESMVPPKRPFDYEAAREYNKCLKAISDSEQDIYVRMAFIEPKPRKKRFKYALQDFKKDMKTYERLMNRAS